MYLFIKFDFSFELNFYIVQKKQCVKIDHG